MGDESEGVHELLAFAIQRADLDLRKLLYSNIVLSGGSTLFRGSYSVELHYYFEIFFVYAAPYVFCVNFLVLDNSLWCTAGFGDRLLSELKKVSPKELKIKVRLLDY